MGNPVRSLVRSALGKVMARFGVILSGAGRGMRFDPTGGSLRYILGPIIKYEEEALVKYLDTGAVYYDIGANIGFYAIVGARAVGPTGKVIAFEFFPESVEAIKRNVAINGLTNLTVEPRAVDKQSGWMSLEITGISEMHKLDLAKDGDAAPGTNKVPTVSIDDFVFKENGPPPSLVMIDVEGAEFRVLEGMKRTMKEHRPIVICENHWLLDEMVEFCKNQLPDLGYTVTRLGGGDIPDTPIWYHFLLMPKERNAK